MRCDLKPVGQHTQKPKWTVFACQRNGCGRKIASPYQTERINADCRAWPRPHELGYWLDLFIEALFFRRQLRQWLWAKFGQLPPLTTEGEGPGTELAKMLHVMRAGVFSLLPLPLTILIISNVIVR